MFTTMIGPVLDAVYALITPAITLVTAVGLVWCIVLGVKYARAEEAQDRDKAKSALINAIIGYVLIFVLMAVLQVSYSALYSWLQSYITSLEAL